MEECAEVTQAISKILRFGWDAVNPMVESDKNNKSHLEEEIGDLLAMIEIVTDRYNLSAGAIQSAKLNKIDKLKKWSNIFN
jgi:NTP pyrophosphatase (non-canonical NTP hydrolase)